MYVVSVRSVGLNLFKCANLYDAKQPVQVRGWDGDAFQGSERKRPLHVMPLPQLHSDIEMELR
jgi:hypothetical protein